MSRIVVDIQYSARAFTRTPGLAFALLFTIALGIGSNVSVYGFIRGLSVRDSSLTAIGSVVSVFVRDAHRDAGLVSYEDFLSLRSRVDVFEWLGAARESQGTIRLNDQSLILSVAAITGDLAGALRLPEDAGVVISHRVWMNEFRAKANVLASGFLSTASMLA